MYSNSNTILANSEAQRLEQYNVQMICRNKAQVQAMEEASQELDLDIQKFHQLLEELNELRRVGGPIQDIEQIEKNYTTHLNQVLEVKQYVKDKLKAKNECFDAASN